MSPTTLLPLLKCPPQLWQFLGAVFKDPCIVDLGHVRNANFLFFSFSSSVMLPMKWQEAETLPPLQLLPCKCYMWLTVSLNHPLSTGHCTASLLNRRQVSLVLSHSSSWAALPWDAKISQRFCGKFLLSASCHNPSLARTQTWIHMVWAKRGPFIWDHHSELCPQTSLSLLDLCKAFSTKLGTVNVQEILAITLIWQKSLLLVIYIP